MFLDISRILGLRGPIKSPIGLILRNKYDSAIGVTWGKPDIGWTKLNFDGSCKVKTGRASIGGLFRDHKAEFLLGYAESIGKMTSTIAELAALHRGLELVRENGWHNVWIEGDAMTMLEIILQKKKAKCEEVQKLVIDINLIIPELENLKLTHIYREGNRAADKLAKMGHGLKEPRIWLQTPYEVEPIVREDAEGRSIPRKRNK